MSIESNSRIPMIAEKSTHLCKNLKNEKIDILNKAIELSKTPKRKNIDILNNKINYSKNIKKRKIEDYKMSERK